MMMDECQGRISQIEEKQVQKFNNLREEFTKETSAKTQLKSQFKSETQELNRIEAKKDKEYN
jgi:hypothetical protein